MDRVVGDLAATSLFGAAVAFLTTRFNLMGDGSSLYERGTRNTVPESVEFAWGL